MPTTSLKLPDVLKEKIATIARKAEQTPHAYMVEAIAERVARDERRNDFLAEGEGALADFRRTGTAYSARDVFPYIQALAAGKKPRRPKAIKVPRAKR